MGVFWSGSDPRSALIHGGGRGGVLGKVRSMIHGVPSPLEGGCRLTEHAFNVLPITCLDLFTSWPFDKCAIPPVVFLITL